MASGCRRKSQTLNDVLQRIPASEVVRIEILRGSEVAGDASGDAVLANVVRTPSTGGGAWGLGMELAEARPGAERLVRLGRTSRRHGIFARRQYLRAATRAARRAPCIDGAGALMARRRDVSPREFAEYAFNGQAARPLGGGKLVVHRAGVISRYNDDSGC